MPLPSKQYDNFRRLLIQHRQSRSVTQSQLAASLDRPQSFISKYENGERRLDLIEFLEIVKALSIDPGNFLLKLEMGENYMSILDDWGITTNQLSDLIKENPSLRGVMLGYVAELKLKEIISNFPEVSYTTKFDDHDRKKKGDLFIVYQDKAFDIESKSLQTSSVKWEEKSKRWLGKAQVDASDKREVILPDGSTLNTTLLLREEFDVLAVNCYAFNNQWDFVFARNSDIPCSKYRKYTKEQRESLIASSISVTWPPEPPFYYDLRELLDDMISDGLGRDPKELYLT